MLLSPTIEKLREIKCFGMIEELENQLKNSNSQKLSFEDRLGLIIDKEILNRDNRSLQARLLQAKLKQKACIENIDFRADRKIDKKTILSLSSCQWIKEHRNIILTGATGVGKSYIACALAHKACIEGYRTSYLRASRMFPELAMSRADGKYAKIMKGLSKVDLLIIDDWGLHKLNEIERRDFLEIMEDRYSLKSTIITSQLNVSNWHQLIGDATIADAILDRIIHNSYRISISGPTMRSDKKVNNEQ